MAIKSPAKKISRTVIGLAAILLITAAGIVGIRYLQQSGPNLGSQPIAIAAEGDERLIKVDSDSTLKLAFNDPVDLDKVEEHVTIDPPLEGRWSADKASNTVEFLPLEPLKSEEVYTIQLDGKVPLKNGALLGQVRTTKFVVAGAPIVAMRMPVPSSTDIDVNDRVLITFDRPMVPLVAVADKPYVQNIDGLSIQPKIDGQWKWLSTSTVEFVPKNGLALATYYTVYVAPGIASVAGGITKEEFTWEFATIRPQLIKSDPYKGFSTAGRDTEVVLTFNHEVELSSVSQKVQMVKMQNGKTFLTNQEVGVLREHRLPTKIATPVAFNTAFADGDKTKVVLIPNERLTLNTWYNVLADTGIKSQHGPLESNHLFNMHFRTADRLKVVDAKYQYGQIWVKFNNPLQEDSLKGAINLNPPPADGAELEWNVSSWSKNSEITLYPELKPSTDYTLTIAGNVTDEFNQILGEPYRFVFKTKPIDPRVKINTKGEFGIFESSKPPIYHLNSVNVSQLNIDLAKLSLDEFLSMRRAKRGDWRYNPDLSEYSSYQHWDIDTKNNQDLWEIEEFNVERQIGRELDPGIYALKVQAPEYHDKWDPKLKKIERQFFALTQMALTLKYTGNRALVWVTDMQTGDAIEGADIQFHALDGSTPIRGRTDENGLMETAVNLKDFVVDYDRYSPEFWVTARTGGDFAFVGSNWNSGINPSYFGYGEEFQGAESGKYVLYSHLYTDRPLYRAGDTVNFKAIFRFKNLDGDFEIPSSNYQAAVTIRDSEGNEIYKESLPINEFGSAAGSVPIDPKANLGSYGLNIRLTPEAEVQRNYTWQSFSVLAYRKPEFKVTVETEKENYVDGEDVKATVDGQYFFGAPMPGATVDWRVISTDYFFNKYTEGWYSFSLESRWCWWEACERGRTVLTSGQGELDNQGKLSLGVTTDLSDKAVSQVVSIDATVTDQNNQTVSAQASVPVHKANVYVGIQANDSVVGPGEGARVSLITLRPNGDPAARQKVTIKLFERSWNTVRKQGVDGEYYYDNEPEDTYVSEEVVNTDAEGKAIATLTLPEGGTYRAVAEVTEGGKTIKSAVNLYSWSSTYINWGRSNNDRMELVADKPEYQVGDTAKILIKSPFQGESVKALVTVEREQILSRRIIPITSSAQTIEIPIQPHLIPNAYVSVVVVKPRIGETFDENGLDTGAPAFKVGYTKLAVNSKQKEATVSIHPDKKRYLPGETVNITLKAKDFNGQPVVTEFSLAAVDMSVLSLTGYSLPDLVKKFYSNRGLGVRTTHLLMYLIERYKPGSKGGGGGSEDNLNKKRSEFKDTAYWNPSIISNDQGWATVSFKLPDNLTTWKLIALGNTKLSLFGSKDEEVIETKPVIVRPVRPRFAIQGDEIELSAIVHNFLETEQSFDVSLNGTGFTSKSWSQHKIKLQPGAQRKVNFPVTVNRVDELTLTFAAKADNIQDVIEEKIPVYEFSAPQTVATSGLTEGTTVESIFVPDESRAKNVKVKTMVTPTMASFLPEGLEYVVKYPYGCAEQIISRFLPNVAVARLQGFEAFKFVSDSELKDNITTGLAGLYTYQRHDGGFGYWGSSRKSYPYLSAYILFGLEHAQRAGYTVDGGVITRTRQYLSNVLRDQDLEDEISLSTRAYILYVLAESGSTDLAMLNNLAPKAKELPLFAQAYLAMAYQKAGQTRRAVGLLQDILNKARVTARGVHFEEKSPWRWRRLMHTNTRTTAIVLQTINRIDPNHPLVPKAVRWLLDVRRDGHWDTTQSTTMSILALTEFLETTGELQADYEARVELNGSEAAKIIVDAQNVLKQHQLELTGFNPGNFNDLIFSKTGEGRLYYDVTMSYDWITTHLPAAEEGMSITRVTEPFEDGGKGLAVNTVHKVTLTITAPEDRHFVAVESPLPAGLEAIDFKYKTTDKRLQEKLSNEASEAKEEYNYYWWSRWYDHSEFRDDKVFLFADYLPAGVYEYTYLVRGTMPGTFHERPARAFMMYEPDVFGQTEGKLVRVKN